MKQTDQVGERSSIQNERWKVLVVFTRNDNLFRHALVGRK